MPLVTRVSSQRVGQSAQNKLPASFWHECCWLPPLHSCILEALSTVAVNVKIQGLYLLRISFSYRPWEAVAVLHGCSAVGGGNYKIYQTEILNIKVAIVNYLNAYDTQINGDKGC